MKKVLMLLKSNQYAGAEQVVIEIMQALGEEYEFYYVSPSGKIAERLETYGLNYLPLQGFHIKEIKRAINMVKPDIVHAHDFSASVVAAFLRGFYKEQKLISHIHYNARENTVWGKKAILYRAALQKIDFVIGVSRAVIEEAVFQNALKYKSMVLGNPVDKERILQLAEEKADGCYDVVFIGRLSKQKNPQKFIRIIHLLKQSGENIRAAIVGDGELFEECGKLLQQFEIEQQVQMLGFLDNPYPVIKNSKVFCMTSEEEGFGLAVAEAMVLEKPVLVSKVGGMKEFFEEASEEFCETEEEYVCKIKRLLRDERFYRKEQERMKQKAESFLDFEGYVQEIRGIYESL